MADDTRPALHTSPVHVPVFDELRGTDHPGLALFHLVPSRVRGPAHPSKGVGSPDAVSGEILALLAGNVAEDASAVLCTCSTIGGVAESAAATLGVPVLRVDRPMAARCRGTGTRGGTRDRLRAPGTDPRAARRSTGDRPVEVRAVMVDGAWACFEADDRHGCPDLVAATADGVADADAIVPAQASMADAVTRTATRIPVLSSPRPGLAAAAAAAR
ncbi:arylsulfatase [Streptomyces sp. NPDC002012]|uniref:arylsulfatase n=1 Tax=Streptomyces sp. NPDC002012 TaxID=3154532 RepID=UPI003332A90F